MFAETLTALPELLPSVDLEVSEWLGAILKEIETDLQTG